MDYPMLYRKRIIPNECVLLKDDLVLSWDEERIVTKWNALKPKKNLHHGYSCYFLKAGYKVSKFYREDGSLLYYYCDIISHKYSDDNASLIVTDLLADVIIYPDGFVKVLDVNELAIALEKKLCDPQRIIQALKKLDSLLNLIYDNKFDTLSSKIEQQIL